MMDHDPSRCGEKPSKPAFSLSPAAPRLRTAALRERLSRFAARLGLARFRNIPGLGWVVAVAAIALFIQAVGLANLIAVNDEKQQWESSANQRQHLLDEIRETESKQLDGKKELHTLKGMIDHESGRLAEVQAGLKLTQQLRDEAQREQGAASSDANRLREANASAEARMKDFAARLASAETLVKKLEGDRDQLAAELAASKQTIDERRAEVDRATAHVKDLDVKAATTLEAIRASREAQLKAQADLNEALKQLAKSNAECEAAQARLLAANGQIKDIETSIDSLTKQKQVLAGALANDKKLADEASAAKIQIDAEVTAVREKLEKAGKLLAEKQGALAAEEAMFSAAQTRHDAIKSRIAMLQAELKPIEEQRLSIDADIAGKKKELETLRERLEAARIDLKAVPAAPPAKVEPAPGLADQPKSESAKEQEMKLPQKGTEGTKEQRD